MPTITTSIVFALAALILFITCGLYLERNKIGHSGFAFLFAFMFFVGSHFLPYDYVFSNGKTAGIKIGIETTLQARLNKHGPINDVAQLYGYAGLSKSYDETSEETEYFLKLEERIASHPFLIFDKVRVSKEIWDNVETNKVYPSGESAGLEE